MAVAGEARRHREEMVKRQLEARGIRDKAVLRAMREVPREKFVPDDLQEFAYADVALPITEGQTISQPYIVALMAQMARLGRQSRVLEIGTGSGYSAAVLSRLAAEVYTVERHASLAQEALRRLQELGYDNVRIRVGDGTLGWPEHAPYDVIVVTAGGPQVPQSLLEQLKVGGRLVIPVGEYRDEQTLRAVTRTGESQFVEEATEPVSFVPLIGKEGWHDGAPGESAGAVAEPVGELPPTRSGIDTAGSSSSAGQAGTVLTSRETLARMVASAAEPFARIEDAGLEPLLDRLEGCRVVLIGEATHGTSEFYRMRARITQELIARQGFNIVGVEADWPDAAQVDRYVRAIERPARVLDIFSRFPNWMWKNLEVLEFVEWLRRHNAERSQEVRAGFFGLDLYSLYSSIDEVLHYLDNVDPQTAQVARQRYGCLTPFESDPSSYGLAALTGRYRECEEEVVKMLQDLLRKRLEYGQEDGERYFDAAQNALIVANAEKYYRAMYYGAAESWNLRDTHMFQTLQSLLQHYGPDSKAVVWAHNSHCGDASVTEMSARGELNIGQLCREEYGDRAYIIGFGTDSGTVVAAHNWGGEVQVMQVRPSNINSYERVCHESGVPAFLLALREPKLPGIRDELQEPRLERAIGVVYRPETELMSHYFYANLPYQFDEYIWFDKTQAVTPFGPAHAPGLPQAHPFVLVDE